MTINLDYLFNSFIADEEIQTGDYYPAKKMLLWLGQKDFIGISKWFRNTPLSYHKQMTIDEMKALLEGMKKENKEVLSAIHWLEGLIKFKEIENGCENS
jgi:hypothetical protein